MNFKPLLIALLLSAPAFAVSQNPYCHPKTYQVFNKEGKLLFVLKNVENVGVKDVSGLFSSGTPTTQWVSYCDADKGDDLFPIDLLLVEKD